MLELLHGESAGVGRSFIVAACSIVRHMLAQYPEMAVKYIVHPVLEPLAITTESKEGIALNLLNFKLFCLEPL